MTEVTAGPLVVAVSGGVDSVVLLDMLVKRGAEVIVAHVNHGMRADSDEDEAFVRVLASSYNVPFVSTRLMLDPDASEEAARNARYAWLEEMRTLRGALAIATAHHQDDVIETILINLQRGTGWRGLCSLRSTAVRMRPLLSTPKAQIVAYAIEHNLEWREDSTNESLRYFRNRIRHQIVPRLSATERQKLINLYDSQLILRNKIDNEAALLCETYCEGAALMRYPLIMIDESSAFEILRAWLGMSLEKKRLQDLLVFAKTAQNGAKWSLDKQRFVAADRTRLIVLSYRD